MRRGDAHAAQEAPAQAAPAERSAEERRQQPHMIAQPAIAERVRRAGLRIPLPLVALLTAALALRIFTMDAYRPAVLTMADSTAYVWAAGGELYGDAVRPAGYSLFLRGAHLVSADVSFTIGVQHLFGLVSALLLYLTTRRLGGGQWLSLVPAGAVALSGDQMMLEHTLLSEAPFTFLLCSSVYAAVRMLDSRQPALWGASAGLLLAAAATVRTAALVLVPLLALWGAFSVPGTWQRRLASGGAVLAAGVALLGAYSVFQHRAEGTWTLTRASGWALYSRVAPFANCTEFTPPRETRFLCETTPTDQRPGPEYYGWVGGPARARFGDPPTGNSQLEAFSQRVVLNQPIDYARAVLKDTVRYFVPGFGFDRAYGGTGPELFVWDRRAPGYEEQIEAAVESYYDSFDLRLSPGGVRALADYQDLVRVHGILLFQLLALGVVGLFLTSGRSRRGLILLLGTTIVLLVLPAATTAYSARYALPVEGLAAAAAALAGSAVLVRLRGSGTMPNAQERTQGS